MLEHLRSLSIGLLERGKAFWLVGSCVLALISEHSVQAQSVPAGFSNALVMAGWEQPVGFTFDANGRWYVWEKGGKVWIVENGVKLATPLIDIGPEVGNWGDHGLLGFALDPDFLANGRIYLMYVVDRHHLMNFGTANYNAATNDYFSATIIRIARYTATGPGHNTVDTNSRTVLLGETRQTGVPILHDSHGAGSLIFGRDGTLLVSLGDGASYNEVDTGSAPDTYYQQALTDGIIRPAENVGAMRSQLLDCMNGKILRIDPNTGDGIASNPFYDAAQPRAPRSRVWAMGFRNPYRITIRPGTGSLDPTEARPGTLYIGDVGWNSWEDLNVCYEGGMNFGWPIFEGMTNNGSYAAALTQDQDAPNPLYGITGCDSPYFNFQDLLVQDTPVHLNVHPNPCDATQQIPPNIPTFVHTRPVIDWSHGNESRCPGFNGTTPVTYDLDIAGSPVVGPRFGGNASVGGAWITGAGWPLGYQNVYMHGDYGGAWVRRFTFDAQEQPLTAADFGTALGAVVFMAQGPDGALWYVKYESNAIWKVSPIGITNLPPIAVATQSTQYGPGPLQVSFSAAGSSDPENGTLSYSWDFGDASSNGSGTQVIHVFNAPPGVPTSFTVTLTVTDPVGATNSVQLLVSVNNTPPVVSIVSPLDGSLYPPGVDTVYALQATVTDAEHTAAQLSYTWRTILHHDNHIHPGPAVNTVTGTTNIAGVGCYSEEFSYEVRLIVTDAAGLSTMATSWLYPRCSALAPTAVISTDVSYGLAPFTANLSGAGSVDNGTIVSYDWNFGDGTTATGMNVSRSFTVAGDYQVTLTVTDDDGMVGATTRPIKVLSTAAPQCVGATGSITREYYANISGATLADLTSAPAYPGTPTSTDFPSSFQSTSNTGDNYGARFRGYIIAPTTGNYVFTAVSDDASEVYLSLNAEPLYKQRICSVPGWTNPGEFNKYVEQTSAAVPLVAGRYYYVEMLHKEGQGGDHAALYWQTPTNGTRAIIPGSALARWQDCPPSIALRTELQGPFDAASGLMHDDLRAAALVPSSEPYTGAGFTQAGGGGETMPAWMLNITGKNAVVDWVLVELRDKNTPSMIVATKSAVLQRDGDIVGVDGYQRLLFNVPADDYFVAVRHRNHLGVMSSVGLTLGPDVVNYDFSLPAIATYGSNARTSLAPNRSGQWCGNAFRDGLIKYTGTNNDRDPILTQVGSNVPTNTVTSYSKNDVNLDGLVKYTGTRNDRDPIIVNLGGNTPNTTRSEQLP